MAKLAKPRTGFDGRKKVEKDPVILKSQTFRVRGHIELQPFMPPSPTLILSVGKLRHREMICPGRVGIQTQRSHAFQQLQRTSPDPGCAQYFDKDPSLSMGMPIQLGDCLNAISFVFYNISVRVVLRCLFNCCRNGVR